MQAKQRKRIDESKRGDLDLEVQIQRLKDKVEILDHENAKYHEENQNLRLIISRLKEELKSAGSQKDPAPQGKYIYKTE